MSSKKQTVSFFRQEEKRFAKRPVKQEMLREIFQTERKGYQGKHLQKGMKNLAMINIWVLTGLHSL